MSEEGRRTDSKSTTAVSPIRIVSGKQAPAMPAAEPHGFVSIDAVTDPEPVFATVSENGVPLELPRLTVVLPVNVVTSDCTFVELPKQDDVPAGHIAVPGNRSQQSPDADLQGPGVPVQTEQTAEATIGSEKSLHSTAPAGHVVVFVKNGKHMPLGCWQGP